MLTIALPILLVLGIVVFFLLPFALVLAIALGINAPDAAPPVELGSHQDQNFLLDAGEAQSTRLNVAP